MSSSPKKPVRKPARKPAPGRPGDPAREGERLQKVLAAAGVASRRAAEELIEAGRVTVNGRVVKVQGMRVDPKVARIEVDGDRIAVDPAYEYVMLNKPEGIVSTVRDPQGRPTVRSLVDSEHRLYPVGRLDIDTTGLVLLTNHGELAHRLTHPRYRVERVYVALVHGNPTAETLRRLEKGIELVDGMARARRARPLARASDRTRLEITMTEGRKHEVRRLLEAVGYPVEQLARTAFGPLKLGRLRVGHSRALRPDEVGLLLKATAL
jgi:23S rRNA pseudouridine2605 synthase